MDYLGDERGAGGDDALGKVAELRHQVVGVEAGGLAYVLVLAVNSDGVDDDEAGAAREMKKNADILVNTLDSFGVKTTMLDICRGPSVTRYELQPQAGIKVSRITSLSDDIALNLATAGVRIEAPIPGKPQSASRFPIRSAPRSTSARF